MSYYTASGEPPGRWAGTGAARLGLTGVVDPGVIQRLFMERIGPDGERQGPVPATAVDRCLRRPGDGVPDDRVGVRDGGPGGRERRRGRRGQPGCHELVLLQVPGT